MTQGSTNSDWTGQVAITGLGMVTPVGLTADIAMASMRAGISRIGELPFLEIEVDEGEFAPVTGAAVPALAEQRQGAEKLSKLVMRSLLDALCDAGIDSGQIEIVLGIADDRPADRVLGQGAVLQNNLAKTLPVSIRATDISLVPAGRAAALRAIRIAAQAVSSGRADVAVAGGVDSWTMPRSLAWLQEEQRLREFPRRTGILPGEAAGFLVLESTAHAQARGARIQAVLTGAAGRTDTTPPDEPVNGQALAEAIGTATRGIEDPHALVISDLNGERYRAHEWMYAVTKGMWRYQTLRHWHPAEYMGDSGAASGVVAAGWAVKALQRGYAKTPNVLVWGASDHGVREAVVIRG